MNEKEKPERLKAVAMRYEAEQDQAPRVVAKGAGTVAQRIIECAAEHGVPIYNDAALTAALSRLELNAQIPESLYRAMAEVLAFVYRLNRQMQ